MSTRGRVIVVYDENNNHNLGGKLTVPVAIICIAISFSGFLYGLDSGAAVNVSKSPSFLKKFFPAIASKMQSTKNDEFCVFNTQLMLMHSSAPYVSGMFSAFLSGYLTTSAGRKGALMIGGITYTIGAAIQASAVNEKMLILSRLIIGFGLGFTTQASSIYMTEMAPTKWRGAFGSCFQLFFSFGLFTAFILNYYTIKNFEDNGWRIALGICALPGMIITIAAILMPDSPSSLIQRGKMKEALESLNQVRGNNEGDVENELNFLIKYNGAVNNGCEKPYHMLLERRYRPHVVLATVLPALQHLTGSYTISNLVMIFFKSLGYSSHQMFVRSLIINVAVILSVFVAILLIDRAGRRKLFVQGSIQIIICQIGLGILMASQIAGTNGTATFTKGSAIVGTILIVFVNLAFAWSWGPLPWLIPTEILPVEIRPVGQALSVATNFAFRFIVSLITVPLLCQFKYAMFFCYATLVSMALTFVVLFVPETKRIPLESIDRILHNHWYWHRFVGGSAPKL